MAWSHELAAEKVKPSIPVTLPVVKLADISDEAIEQEARAAAAKVVERRVLREGLDCWREIGRAESYEHWKKIAAALAVGKRHAVKITGADWGQNYSREFGAWLREWGFGSMPKATRSWAIILHERGTDIEQWRTALSERERKRLINPQSVVKRWQRETQKNGEQRRDDVAAALTAWRLFVARVGALPAEQAAPVWRAVSAEAAAHAAAS